MNKLKGLLQKRWGLVLIVYCVTFLIVAVVNSINECSDVGGFWSVAREHGFIRTWIELNYLVLPNAIIYSAFITGGIFLLKYVLIGFADGVADTFFRGCPHCKRLFAIQKLPRTLKGAEEISVLVELKDKNSLGDVTGTHEQYIPGKRNYYEVRHLCKYCGYEYIKETTEVVKHV